MSDPKVCDRCGDEICPMRWTGDRDKAFLLSIAVCNSNRIAAALEHIGNLMQFKWSGDGPYGPSE